MITYDIKKLILSLDTELKRETGQLVLKYDFDFTATDSTTVNAPPVDIENFFYSATIYWYVGNERLRDDDEPSASNPAVLMTVMDLMALNNGSVCSSEEILSGTCFPYTFVYTTKLKFNGRDFPFDSQLRLNHVKEFTLSKDELDKAEAIPFNPHPFLVFPPLARAECFFVEVKVYKIEEGRNRFILKGESNRLCREIEKIQ